MTKMSHFIGAEGVTGPVWATFISFGGSLDLFLLVILLIPTNIILLRTSFKHIFFQAQQNMGVACAKGVRFFYFLPKKSDKNYFSEEKLIQWRVKPCYFGSGGMRKYFGECKMNFQDFFIHFIFTHSGKSQPVQNTRFRKKNYLKNHKYL